MTAAHRKKSSTIPSGDRRVVDDPPATARDILKDYGPECS